MGVLNARGFRSPSTIPLIQTKSSVEQFSVRSGRSTDSIRQTRRAGNYVMIKAGIIGLGPVWEARYCPALDALTGKVKVAAIYDAVEERAKHAAKRFDAQTAQGVLSLSRRRDLDACLILGKDWTNLPALKFLCEARKPAYIAGSLGHEIPTVGEIHLLALSEGLTFMPEFARRYTPATVRLRELIATRLGKADRILCDARLPLPSRRDYVPGQADYEDFLIGLFDWCLHILPGSTSSACRWSPQNGPDIRPAFASSIAMRKLLPHCVSIKPNHTETGRPHSNRGTSDLKSIANLASSESRGLTGSPGKSMERNIPKHSPTTAPTLW